MNPPHQAFYFFKGRESLGVNGLKKHMSKNSLSLGPFSESELNLVVR